MLPLHENHVDFLSAKQSLSADIEFQLSLPVRGATRQQSKEVPMDEFQSTLPVRGATANLHKINAEILAECLIILRKTEKRGQKACIGWKTKAKSRKRQENKVRRIRKIHDSLRAAPCVYTIKIPSAS